MKKQMNMTLHANSKIGVLCLVASFLLFMFAMCSKDPEVPIEKIVVVPANNIGSTWINFSGTYAYSYRSPGSAECIVSERPNMEGTIRYPLKLIENAYNAGGVYNAGIENCLPNTDYYYKFVFRRGDTSYETDIMTVRTLGYTPPQVVTMNITNISSSSAQCGGVVTNDGGTTITARGVCWSTSLEPTIDNTHTSNNGSGTGSFISYIPYLSPNTTYYVRAYATNSAGTCYGEQKRFRTLD